MVLNEEDKIDVRVAEYENKLVKVCSNDECKKLYKSLKRKCDICKSEVVRLQKSPDLKIATAIIDTDELANNVGQQEGNEIHPDRGGGGGTHSVTDTMVLSANYAILTVDFDTTTFQPFLAQRSVAVPVQRGRASLVYVDCGLCLIMLK